MDTLTQKNKIELPIQKTQTEPPRAPLSSLNHSAPSQSKTLNLTRKKRRHRVQKGW